MNTAHWMYLKGEGVADHLGMDVSGNFEVGY